MNAYIQCLKLLRDFKGGSDRVMCHTSHLSESKLLYDDPVTVLDNIESVITRRVLFWGQFRAAFLYLFQGLTCDYLVVLFL